MTTSDERDRYDRARRRVRQIRAFYLHATVFGVINALLHLINLVTTSGTYWAFWPLLGWGIGLLAHALATYRWTPFFCREWEERKIKELLDKDRGKG